MPKGEHQRAAASANSWTRAVDFLQFDTSRVGGLAQARKIAPPAGRMHYYHVEMGNLNSPLAELFPPVEVEVGNERFRRLFNGESLPKDAFIDPNEHTPGLGVPVDEAAWKKLQVSE